MNNLCCLLNGVKLHLGDSCTCDIRGCSSCLRVQDGHNSEFFEGYNGLADYHYKVFPKCPAVKIYEDYRFKVAK